MIPPLSHTDLKAKQRELRDGFPINLSLRVHRALSWLDRAEQANDDLDAAFIFYWIAFNAAYAKSFDDTDHKGERVSFEAYFKKMISLDKGRRIYRAIWSEFNGPIELLLKNKYVFAPFWKHQNGQVLESDWQLWFKTSQHQVKTSFEARDSSTVLTVLFPRIYVLRNQILHGGATWNSAVNREQVDDCKKILARLVPLFIDLMMDAPNEQWDKPCYPVVEG